MRLASLLMELVLVVMMLMAGCGEDHSITSDASVDFSTGAGFDMCFYGDVSGQSCTLPNGVTTGTCFESPSCVCVFPEAIWVCCYAGYGGHDAPGLHLGDPCCGENVVVGEPGYPCYCDGTHHWTCPMDLGTTD
jgi:hypothetical protein